MGTGQEVDALTRDDGIRLARAIDRKRLSMDPPLSVKAIGISAETLAAWRSGARTPRGDAIAKVAARIGWTYEYALALARDVDGRLPLDPVATEPPGDLLGRIVYVRDRVAVAGDDIPEDVRADLEALAGAAIRAVDRMRD